MNWWKENWEFIIYKGFLWGLAIGFIVVILGAVFGFINTDKECSYTPSGEVINCWTKELLP